VRTISIEALVTWLNSTEPPRLIDVLGREHFELVHLPGAENIPRAELRQRALKEIGLDEPVVVYCSDRDCSESPCAAAILEELGYLEVFHFEGGIAEWRRRGLPVLRSVREADRS
jgi:rhodanese-related sulfurtransferase